MYVCTHVCRYACVHVCMYVCVFGGHVDAVWDWNITASMDVFEDLLRGRFICLCVCVCVFADMYVFLYVGIGTHIYTYTYVRTQNHSVSRSHYTHTHTHTHARTYTHTHTHTHTHTYTHVRIRMHTHTPTHPRTHTHMQRYVTHTSDRSGVEAKALLVAEIASVVFVVVDFALYLLGFQVRTCRDVCAQYTIHAYIRTFMHTYMHMHILQHVHTYIHACACVSFSPTLSKRGYWDWMEALCRAMWIPLAFFTLGLVEKRGVCKEYTVCVVFFVVCGLVVNFAYWIIGRQTPVFFSVMVLSICFHHVDSISTTYPPLSIHIHIHPYTSCKYYIHMHTHASIHTHTHTHAHTFPLTVASAGVRIPSVSFHIFGVAVGTFQRADAQARQLGGGVT